MYMVFSRTRERERERERVQSKVWWHDSQLARLKRDRVHFHLLRERKREREEKSLFFHPLPLRNSHTHMCASE